MPAEKGIFLDVLPRFDMAAMGAILSKVEGMFKKSGSAIGATFGTEAQAKIAALAEEQRKAANVMEDASLRMTRAIHAEEVAQQRLNEVTAKGTANASALMRAQYAQSDAALAATARTRDYEAAMLASGAATDRHVAATEAAAITAGNAGRAFNIAGVAMTGGFLFAVAESTKKASEFQSAMVKLTAAGGETQGNIKAVSDGILDLAGKVGISSQQLADAMFLVEKAGYRGGDGIKVLTAAAQLANAEGADLNDTIQGLTTSMRDFGYPVEQAATVASKLNVAAGDSKVTLQSFSSALHNVEPTAAVAKVSLDEVYAAMARITQSGAGADQASEWLNNTIGHLMNMNVQQKRVLQQLGLDPQGLQHDLSNKDIGMVGVIQEVTDKINGSLTPAQQVLLKTQFQSVQAVQSLNKVYEQLSPKAKEIADKINAGTVDKTDLQKIRVGKINEPALATFLKLHTDLDGMNDSLKKGQGDVMGLAEAFAKAFGTDSALKVVSLLAGTTEQAKAMREEVQRVAQTMPEADGTVKGFNETQETLAKKLADAKAGFGAAVIQLGNDFIPTMTHVANGLGDVARFLHEHKSLLDILVGALGAAAAAWTAWKALMVFDGILTGLESLVTWTLRGSVAQGTLTTTTEATTVALGEEAAAADGVALSIGAIGSAAAIALPFVALLAGAIYQSKQAENAPATGGNQALTDKTSNDNINQFDVSKLSVPSGMPKPGSTEAEESMSSLATQGDPGAKWVVSSRGKWDQAAKYAWLMNHQDQDKAGFSPPTLDDNGNVAGPSAARSDDLPFNGGQGRAGGSQNAQLDPMAALNAAMGTPPDGAGTIPQTGWADGVGAGGASTGASAEPLGTQHNPIFMDPSAITDGLNNADVTDNTAGLSDNIGSKYDPFQQAGSGGWSLPNVARLLATFAANAAFGNPYGKLHGDGGLGGFGGGDQGDGPADGATLQESLSKVESMSATERAEMENSLKLKKAIRAYQKALRTYARDLQKYGAGDARTLDAQDSALTARDNIDQVYSGMLNKGETAASRLAEDDAKGVAQKDPLKYQRDAAAASAYGGPSIGGAGNLTPAQTDVARKIIAAGQARGLSREQIIAGLDVANLESAYGANPLSRVQQNQSGTIVQGVFQQDTGYSGDHNDASNAAGQYFDRFIARGGLHNDPYAGAVKVQQGVYGGDYVKGQHQEGVYDRLAGPVVAGPTGGGQGYPLPWKLGGGPLSPDLNPGPTDPAGGLLRGPLSGGTPAAGPKWIPGKGFVDQFGNPTSGPDATPGERARFRASTPGAAPGSSGPHGGYGDQYRAAHSPGAIGAPGGAPGVVPSTGPQTAQPTGGTGKGAGIGGGLIGTAEGAAAMAANLFAPGSGQAVQMATQEANRAVGYAGQVAGILTSGLMETFSLHDGSGGGGKGGWLNKIANGLAGAHASVPNQAASSAPPVSPDDGKQQQDGQQDGKNGQGNSPLVQIDNYHAHNGDQSGGRDLAREMMAVQ